MKCELCGMPVKVSGKTTKHYEPILLTVEEIYSIINPIVHLMEFSGDRKIRHLINEEEISRLSTKLAKAIADAQRRR